MGSTEESCKVEEEMKISGGQSMFQWEEFNAIFHMLMLLKEEEENPPKFF